MVTKMVHGFVQTFFVLLRWMLDLLPHGFVRSARETQQTMVEFLRESGLRKLAVQHGFLMAPGLLGTVVCGQAVPAATIPPDCQGHWFFERPTIRLAFSPRT